MKSVFFLCFTPGIHQRQHLICSLETFEFLVGNMFFVFSFLLSFYNFGSPSYLFTHSPLFLIGNDHCSSVCPSRRGTQPCYPTIHPSLQHVVSAHTLRAKPQTDLQSEDEHTSKHSYKTQNTRINVQKHIALIELLRVFTALKLHDILLLLQLSHSYSFLHFTPVIPPQFSLIKLYLSFMLVTNSFPSQLPSRPS